MKAGTMKTAACKGTSQDLFYEDVWLRDGIPLADGLTTARSYCDRCPVRRQCLDEAMTNERGTAAAFRAGIFGGLTPRQRHALEKRGYVARCDMCDALFDPVKLRQGVLLCDCGEATMEPIPDRGDNWTPRHTKLAQAVLEWMDTNIQVGAPVPDPTKLARTLTVRTNDLRRVYEALIEDQVLVPEDKHLVLQVRAASTWTPPHTRVAPVIESARVSTLPY